CVYTFLVYWALRLLPGFRLPVFCIALLPMSVHQAASLSSDAVTLGVGFLLISYILKLAYDPTISGLSLNHIIILTGLVAIFVFCKLNFALLSCAFLIPRSRFVSWRVRTIALAVIIGSCLAIANGWQRLDASNIEFFTQSRTLSGVDID